MNRIGFQCNAVFRERSDPMCRIHAARVEKTVVLRKRVTIIEEFEPSKQDEVLDKKETRLTLRTALKRLVIIGGIASIRAFFKSAVSW
jgi:hypothetical protein